MALTRKLLINSDAATPQPTTKEYLSPQVVGRTLAGAPVVQGYASLRCTWPKLTRTQMTKLWGFYNPASPGVTIQYTDPLTNADVTKAAQMEPISVGNVTYNTWDNVTVVFSHLTAVS